MPLPLIIAASVAGALGLGGHLSAKDANEEAGRVSRKAQRLYVDAKSSFEEAKNNAEESLLALGYAKKNVLDDSINRFLLAFERIKDVELGVSASMNEAAGFMIDEQGTVMLRQMSDIYSSAISSSTAGAAAGLLMGLAASGSLSVVTGGMSLAGAFMATGDLVGAAAVAGSTLSLGLSITPLAAIVAPVVLFTGISASLKADENLEKANAMLAEANAAAEKMKVSETMCNAIAERSDMFRDLLVELDKVFSHFVEKLDIVTQEKLQSINGRRIRSGDLSKDEIDLARVTCSLAGAVKAVIDVPMLSKEGTLAIDSQMVYDKVSADYNKKVEEGIVQKPQKEDNIFCTGCGQVIVRDAKFCNYCGKKNTYGEV